MSELPPAAPGTPECFPSCSKCGTEIAGPMLSCPGCGALVHADELKRLAAAARDAHPTDALAHWREALALLPPDSQQFKAIQQRIEAISLDLEKNPKAHTAPRKSGGGSPSGSKGKWYGPAASGGVLLMLLLKFKSVLFVLLSQAKLILIGLTKIGTLGSMFVSMALYANYYGWPLALGGVLCIYIHEMGHVFALKRLGIKATAPMFIPGFGAVIFLKQRFFSPREDARQGLAGPRWGLAASVICMALGFALNLDVCLFLARANAWLNLGNLLPVWQLDGARGFHAMRRPDRIFAGLIFTAAWLPLRVVTGEGWSEGFSLAERIALVAAIGVIFGVLKNNQPESTDQRAFWEYVILCLALTAFNWLPVPSP